MELVQLSISDFSVGDIKT